MLHNIDEASLSQEEMQKKDTEVTCKYNSSHHVKGGQEYIYIHEQKHKNFRSSILDYKFKNAVSIKISTHTSSIRLSITALPSFLGLETLELLLEGEDP